MWPHLYVYVYVHQHCPATNGPEELSQHQHIELGLSNVKLTLDTGAQTSVIPTKEFNKLMPSAPLRKVKCKLYDYEGHPLKVIGYWALTSRYKDKAKMQKFYIVDCNSPPILGLKEKPLDS